MDAFFFPAVFVRRILYFVLPFEFVMLYGPIYLPFFEKLEFDLAVVYLEEVVALYWSVYLHVESPAICDQPYFIFPFESDTVPYPDCGERLGNVNCIVLPASMLVVS